MIIRFLPQLRKLCLTLCGLRSRFCTVFLDRQLFEAAGVFSNEFHSIFGDLYGVGESEPIKPWNVGRWLTRKNHSCLHDRPVSRDEPGRFVGIDSNSVTHVMAEGTRDTYLS